MRISCKLLSKILRIGLYSQIIKRWTRTSSSNRDNSLRRCAKIMACENYTRSEPQSDDSVLIALPALAHAGGIPVRQPFERTGALLGK